MSDSIFNISVTDTLGLTGSIIMSADDEKKNFSAGRVINQLTTSLSDGQLPSTQGDSSVSMTLTPSEVEAHYKDLLTPYSWTLDVKRELTYSFYNIDVFAGNYYGIETGVTEVSESVKDHVRSIFAWLETVINVNFEEVTETTSTYGSLRVMYSNCDWYPNEKDAAAYAYNPYSATDPVCGDMHLRYGLKNDFQEPAGTWDYSVLVHELGHTLGLADVVTTSLPAELSNSTNTVMSYNSSGLQAAEPVSLDIEGTYMPLDIAALQSLYGARQKNTGNDTYLFSDVSHYTVNGQPDLNGKLPTKQTIWDTGGTDTLDLSVLAFDSTGYRIDMNEGGFLCKTALYNTCQYTDYKDSSINYTTVELTAIAYGVTLENLIGSSGNDIIIGNTANNVLNGSTGVDSMTGETGNETYYVDVAGDTITENAGEGSDIVYSTATSYTLSANIENLVIWGAGVSGTGNAQANYIFGGASNNIIDGGAGADILYGGLGSDAYYVDDIGDVTSEIGTDWDVVYSTAASYTLNANIEALFLVDDRVNRNGSGNVQANYLIGNTGNNRLDGQGGADVMAGGAGDDSYIVDNTGDVVVENAGAGADTVYSSISYTLAANTENLVLTGIATDAFGNNLNNQLTGNNANNIFGGGAGADTMTGLTGNDTYYVDVAGDTIIENVGGGTDIVYSTAASYTLADNVDSLIIWGTGVNGTGNAQSNYIISGTGNNTLDGRAGNDVLYGGEGADTYIGGLGADSLNLTEATAATDTVRIATGDSLATVGGYDVVTGFTGIDKLDLASTVIAANVTAEDGIDSGIIRSHGINNGIISFDDINNYTSPLAISASTNLANVFSYLQTNIAGGNTVAFVAENNTYVFQDGGVTDSLVELLGVTATSVNNTGLTANSVWVI